MNVSTLKRAAIILCAILVFNIAAVHVSAFGDGGAGNNGGMRAPSNRAYDAPGTGVPSVDGGGPGINDNSPAAGGGGGGAYGGSEGKPYDGANDDFDGESETGEVLGVTDDDSTAVVGIIIAIIIAVAALVLIIALIPRGTRHI